MNIHIAQGNGVPIYMQIINQTKNLIASGRLQQGHELPPIRVLAEKLLINPNTVARAYRELELAGWVTKRVGAGTFVSGEASPLNKDSQDKVLNEKVVALLVEAQQMKISLNKVQNLIETEYMKMQQMRKIG